MTTLCQSCIYYSEEYLPIENQTENCCDATDNYNFIPKTKCSNYIPIDHEQLYDDHQLRSY